MASSISLPKGFQRLGNFPLDETFVFATKTELDTYASSNPTAYTGQICSVAATGLVYVILSDKSVSQIGSSGAVAPHSQDIASINGLQTALDGKQPVGSYATLDTDGKVPASQLPSYVDDVLEYADQAAFPVPGESAKIYVALDTKKAYRWGGTDYVEISASPGSTDAVPEGTTNLYFTAARASAAAPVQSVAGQTGAVTLVIADVDDLQVALDGKSPATIYSDTLPVNPVNGQRWVDTTDYHAYEYVNGSWIEILSA